MDLVYTYLAFFVAYLVGSVPFAVLVSKAMGLADPRSFGSRNPGATNVLRSGSKIAAALTLGLDVLKGYLPTMLAARYSFDLGFQDAASAETLVAFVGLAAFVGHVFPVFLGFRGGKGVATGLGVLTAYQPALGLMALILWVAVAALFRYASLASVVAAVFAPFFMLLFFDQPTEAVGVFLMSAILLWRHWRNIMKLLAGKESKIGQKVDGSKRRRRRRRLQDDLSIPAPPPSKRG